VATWFILPDWHRRQLSQLLADTVRSDARYLARVIAQYASGRRDDLAYRIARRDAHNAHAALSGVLANMLREPDRHRQGSERLLRFLTSAHTLLGHLSTLGAHRQRLVEPTALDAVQQAGALAVAALDALADALATGDTAAAIGDEARPTASPGVAADSPEIARLVLTQLGLVVTQRDRLAVLGTQISAGT
jgi:uncharacterized membrane protein YccC